MGGHGPSDLLCWLTVREKVMPLARGVAEASAASAASAQAWRSIIGCTAPSDDTGSCMLQPRAISRSSGARGGGAKKEGASQQQAVVQQQSGFGLSPHVTASSHLPFLSWFVSPRLPGLARPGAATTMCQDDT